MEVLNELRQKRRYQNTIIMYTHHKKRPIWEIFQGVEENEFNELFELLMDNKTTKKRYKNQSKLSLYARDGRVLENVYFKNKKILFETICQIYDDGNYLKWNQDYEYESIWLEDNLEKVDEEGMEQFNAMNSNMDVLKTFIANLKLLSPSKEKAIQFGNLSETHDYSHKIPSTWYTWIDEQNVVNFQSNEFYWLDRLDSNLYTYGFQIIDESFEHSPVAKRQKKSSLKWSGSNKEERVVTRSQTRPFVNIRYVFEGLVFLDTKDEYCGLPKSVLKSLKNANVVIENYKESLKQELTLKHEKMLKIIINNVREDKYHEMREYDSHDDYFLMEFKNDTLILKSSHYNNATHEATYEWIKLRFEKQNTTNKLKINDIMIDDGDSTMKYYELSKFFNTRDPIWLKVQDFMMKYFIDEGCYERLDEDEFDCGFHPLVIEMLPYLVLKEYTKFDNVPTIKFLNDTFDETEEEDHGGPSAEFLYLLAQSLFKPFDMRYAEVEEFKKYNVLDMDDTTRFPKYASHVTSEEEKREIMTAILKFFHFAAGKKRLPIGRVFHINYFPTIRMQRDLLNSGRILSIRNFDGSSGSSKRFYLIMMNLIRNGEFNTTYSDVINFILRFFNFDNVKFKGQGQNIFFSCRHLFIKPDLNEDEKETLEDFKKIYKRVLNYMVLNGEDILFYDFNKEFEEQDIESTAPFIFLFWVDGIFLDFALPYLEFNFDLINIGKTRFPYYERYIDFPWVLMGDEFDRVRIAESIVSSQEGMTQEIQDRIMFLKTHIRNESTPIEWVQKFLASITGSITANSPSTIKVKGISTFRLPTAHTCIKTLVLFNGPHEEYRYLPEETGISDSERFIQSITDSLIGQSTGFGFV